MGQKFCFVHLTLAWGIIVRTDFKLETDCLVCGQNNVAEFHEVTVKGRESAVCPSKN